MRYAEQVLTADEHETVEAWLAGHPEAAQELAFYNEAPRLERDESVKYSQHRTAPVWPAVLRWSAAAAVVAALMLPIMLMKHEKGTALQHVAQVRQAEAVAPVADTNVATVKVMEPVVRKAATIQEDMMPVVEAVEDEEIEQIDAVENEVHAVVPEVIYCDNLIVYEPAPDTVYTNNLIVYDDSRRSWTEDVKDWAAESKLAQWVRRRFKTQEAEILALNE